MNTSSNASRAAVGPQPHIAPEVEPSAALDFHVVNSHGRPVYTTNARDLATRWLRARKHDLPPGFKVVAVDVQTTLATIYTPRRRIAA